MKYIEPHRVIAGIFAATCLVLAGCSSSLTPAQQQNADRTAQIARYSNGNWEKGSAPDRAFLIKQAWGGERGARVNLA